LSPSTSANEAWDVSIDIQRQGVLVTIQREAEKKRISETLDSIMNCGSELDAVLDEYDKIKGSPDRAGLCHDIAVAIMKAVHARGENAGWTWCRALLQGGVEHSWVAFGGWCIDMGDNDELRIWEEVHSEFLVDGSVKRLTAPQTIAWAEAIDILLVALRSDIARCNEVRQASFIASGSLITVPTPHVTTFPVEPVAWIGFTEIGFRGVAHGFDRSLTPAEERQVEALFPHHVLTWVP
jgi:hypothetical protein